MLPTAQGIASLPASSGQFKAAPIWDPCPSTMKLTVLIHAPLIVISISLTNATSTEKLVNRQSDIECPAGSSLCVYFSGESCVDTSVGDVCCADGSGMSMLRCCIESPADEWPVRGVQWRV